MQGPCKTHAFQSTGGKPYKDVGLDTSVKFLGIDPVHCFQLQKAKELLSEQNYQYCKAINRETVAPPGLAAAFICDLPHVTSSLGALGPSVIRCLDE